MEITHIPKVKMKYIDEFGNKTVFSTTAKTMTTFYDMIEIFCRFLLACGYSPELIHELNPENWSNSPKGLEEK